MNIELIKLKIKAKSLAEEARIIRKEEHKLKELPFSKRSEVLKYQFGGEYTHCFLDDIKFHRRWHVRNEARATQLAIAYIKGKAYSSIEKVCTNSTMRDFYIVPKVLKMVQTYGNKEITVNQIREWIYK